MATTSVWAVKKRLDHVLTYAMNPDKTGDHPRHDDVGNVLAYVTRDEKVEYVTGVNCLPEYAREQMTLTKQAWNRMGGRLAYHGYQSFAPGEVTPALAHEIGIEFARRMWGERFQVVVATHTDREHIHTHFVVNSVSFVDGKKFCNYKKDYYGGVRAISDAVCREYGLSVIEQPAGRGRQYKEVADEKAGRATRRGLVEADILEAIAKSPSFHAFITFLESRGYTVKHGPKVAHIAVMPKGADGYMRLYKLLGEEYEESGIRQMIEAKRAPALAPEIPPAPTRNRPRRFKMPREHKRMNGWTASYYRYLYLLGKVSKRKAPARVSFALRADLAKLDRYTRQFRFLRENRITGNTELTWYTDALKNEIGVLLDSRKPLYEQRRFMPDSERPAVTAEIESITEALRPLRQKLRLCEQIAQDADIIRQKSETAQAALECRPRQNKAKARETAVR